MNEKQTMKIALVTDDGATISSHFGRARYYEVVTVENGTITHKERREKPGHHTFAAGEGGHHHDHGSGHGHGHDAHSERKHRMMGDVIRDCQYVVARGMGSGAYGGMRGLNITPILTEIRTIDEAVRRVADGTIVDRTERLH